MIRDLQPQVVEGQAIKVKNEVHWLEFQGERVVERQIGSLKVAEWETRAAGHLVLQGLNLTEEA